jgi:hypothetical protein
MAGCYSGDGHDGYKEAGACRTSPACGAHRWGGNRRQARKCERGTRGQCIGGLPAAAVGGAVDGKGRGETLAQYHARRNEYSSGPKAKDIHGPTHYNKVPIQEANKKTYTYH